MSRSVNQANINATKLRGYSITAPPLEQQRFIAATLKDISENTTTLSGIAKQKLSHLTNLKQSLLHKAFTGELTADKTTADRTLSEALA